MASKNMNYKQKRTPPTCTDLQNNISQFKYIIGIILGFWLTYYIIYLLEAPLNAFQSRGLPLGAEYTVVEQLSKLYLFIIVLISVFSYRVSDETIKIKLSISFLLFGLILYMSESNMITEKTQPIFGLIFFICITVLFIRSRSWLSLTSFIVGLALIACGSISDLAHENEFVSSLLPPFMFDFLHITSEERFEITGIAFLCLSAMLCFRVPLKILIAKNTKATLLMLFASGMITSGNGFLHYQYNPSWKRYFFALVMTITGFLGLVFANRCISKKDAILKLVTEAFFYLFIFLFFVVLPSIHGQARHLTALLLWLPSMFFMMVYLWRCHPVNHEVASEKDRV